MYADMVDKVNVMVISVSIIMLEKGEIYIKLICYRDANK